MRYRVLAGLAAGAFAISVPALAEVNLGISIGVPIVVAPPVVVEPPPVYYPAAVAPGHRYVAPSPTVVVVPRWDHHEWKKWREHEDHWRHRRWHEHGDDDDD